MPDDIEQQYRLHAQNIQATCPCDRAVCRSCQRPLNEREGGYAGLEQILKGIFVVIWFGVFIGICVAGIRAGGLG